jgi:hypothetical protein
MARFKIRSQKGDNLEWVKTTSTDIKASFARAQFSIRAEFSRCIAYRRSRGGCALIKVALETDIVRKIL